jgi:Lon protease-like protein
MYEIPLFPLDTVLFPGTPLQLFIFEPRYIRMMNECIEGRKPFGVALIRSGVEAFGPLAEPYYIGCSAQITQVQQLEEGKMNLVAIGQERFRILTLDRRTHPYLLGRVQPIPLENPNPARAARRMAHLRQQFDRFVQKLMQSGSNQLDLTQLPEDAIAFAYLAAAVLQISPLQKQELLTIHRLDLLISRLERYYKRELTLLDLVLSKEESLQAGGFSKN